MSKIINNYGILINRFVDTYSSEIVSVYMGTTGKITVKRESFKSLIKIMERLAEHGFMSGMGYEKK